MPWRFFGKLKEIIRPKPALPSDEFLHELASSIWSEVSVESGELVKRRLDALDLRKMSVVKDSAEYESHLHAIGEVVSAYQAREFNTRSFKACSDIAADKVMSAQRIENSEIREIMDEFGRQLGERIILRNFHHGDLYVSAYNKLAPIIGVMKSRGLLADYGKHVFKMHMVMLSRHKDSLLHLR